MIVENYPRKPTEEELKPAYEHITAFKDFETRAQAIAYLTFPAVVDALTVYLNTIASVSQILRGEKPPEIPTTHSLDIAFAEFQVTVSNFLSKGV